MSIYIRIRKCAEKDQMYWYSVLTEDFGGGKFFIKINKESQRIYFYLNKDDENPVRTMVEFV